MGNRLEFDVAVNGQGFRAGLIQMERAAAESSKRMDETIRNNFNSPEQVFLLKQATIAKRNREMEEKAAAEKKRYSESGSQNVTVIERNYRSENEADQRAWEIKRNNLKAKIELEKKAGKDLRAAQVANEKLVYTPGANFTYGGMSPLEQQGKGFRRNAGGISQLIHSGRASIDSLASGMDPMRVVLQQTPQVVQALMSMNLGWVAIGAAAGIAAAVIGFKLTKGLWDSVTGTKALRESFDDLTRAADRFKVKMEQAYQARKLLTQELANAAKRASDQADSESEAADAATERQKAQLKYEHAFQKDLGFKQTELELEKKLLEIDLKRAKEKEELAKKNLKNNAAVAAAQVKVEEADAAFAGLEERQKKRIADAIKATPTDNPNMFGRATPEQLRARESAVREAINQNDKEAEQLRFALAEAKKNLEAAKAKGGQGEVDKAAANRINIETAIKNLGIKKPAQITESPDSLVRVGNFLGTARGKIESLAQRQVDLMQRYLPEIAHNTKGQRRGGYYPVN